MFDIDRSKRAIKIAEVFQNVGKKYIKKDVVVTFEIYNEHDIHAFYRLASDESRVIHIQGYPGMYTPDKQDITMLMVRLMDYDKMLEVRKNPRISIGNEHEAVIKHYIIGEEEIIIEEEALEKILEEKVPELK